MCDCSTKVVDITLAQCNDEICILFCLEITLHAIHGEYNITVLDDMIKITVHGAFNDVGAKALVSELKDIVLAYEHAPFVIMGNLLDFGGGTPEVFAESEEFNAWLNSRNMIAKALIFTSPALIAIEQTLVKSKSMQNIQYFENENDAKQWLDKQIEESQYKFG